MTTPTPRPSCGGPPPPDPTGVRRLVAAAELHVFHSEFCSSRMRCYKEPCSCAAGPLVEALAAVRVSELERVVEWVRNWLPEKFHGEDVNRGGAVPIHTEFSELIEIRQALAALYAPKEKP